MFLLVTILYFYLYRLGSPFSMAMFGLTDVQAVRYLSLAQGIVGTLTLITYIVYIKFDMERM